MSSLVENPELPFVGAVEGGLVPGKMVKVQGKVPEDSVRFAINYQLGPTLNPRDDIAIHVCPRFTEGFITRNSIQSMTWGPEENFGPMVIQPGQRFEIIILCHYTCFKVAINGQHYADFRHRLPYQKVTHLVVDGDVEISSIFYETIPIGPPPSELLPDAPEANFGPPPPGGIYPTINPNEPSYGGYHPPPTLQQKEEEGSDLMDKIGLAVGGLVAAGGAAALANALHKRSQRQQERQQEEDPEKYESKTHSEREGGLDLGALGTALASSLVANAIQRNSQSNYPAYPSFDPNSTSGGGMLGSILGALGGGGGGGGGHGGQQPNFFGGGAQQPSNPSDPFSGALSGVLGSFLGGGGGGGNQPSNSYQPSGGYGYGSQQPSQPSNNLLGGLGAALGSSFLSSAFDSFTKPKDKHKDDDYRPPDRTQPYDHRYDPEPPRAPSYPQQPSGPPPQSPSGGSGGKLSAAEISKGLGLGEDDE